MREIRFRTWDRVLKGFLFFELTNSGIKILNEDFNSADTDRENLQQYTGLKDKNGKEIYEGDIVKLSCWKPLAYPEGYKGLICWNQESHKFAVELFGSKGKIYSHNWHAGMHDCFRYMEVIGNKFENPELMKEEELDGTN